MSNPLHTTTPSQPSTLSNLNLSLNTTTDNNNNNPHPPNLHNYHHTQTTPTPTYQLPRPSSTTTSQPYNALSRNTSSSVNPTAAVQQPSFLNHFKTTTTSGGYNHAFALQQLQMQQQQQQQQQQRYHPNPLEMQQQLSAAMASVREQQRQLSFSQQQQQQFSQYSMKSNTSMEVRDTPKPQPPPSKRENGPKPKPTPTQSTTSPPTFQPPPPKQQPSSPPPPTTPLLEPPIARAEALAKLILGNCTWQDKTIHVGRNILGGSTINGFLRATAAAQRIKKQRLRQLARRLEDDAAAHPPEEENGKKDRETQKRDMMNVRTAKKLRLELSAGVAFCKNLSGIVTSVLKEMETSGGGSGGSTMVSSSSAALEVSKKNSHDTTNGPNRLEKETESIRKDNEDSLTNSSVSNVTKNDGSGLLPAATKIGNHSAPETVEAGNPSGSTLRKHRKTHPPHPPPPIPSNLLPQFDENGKKLSRKELSYKSFEYTRFRPLRRGDYVAARVSSREMYIVAKVLQDYDVSEDVSRKELMGMSEAKRSIIFKDKVLIQDVEDNECDLTKAKSIVRDMILPLPRSYGEAAEWGTRCRKGSRVYAMYPSTTSLYCASVVDNTTYCRGEDDIIVVEFDGDEDDFGALPQRHIPARFVTLIPRELPSSHPIKKKSSTKKSNTTHPPPDTTTTASNNHPKPDPAKPKKKSTTTASTTNTTASTTAARTTKPKSPTKKPKEPLDDSLNSLIDQMAYGEWSDGDEDALGNFPDLDMDPAVAKPTNQNSPTSKGKKPIEKTRKRRNSSSSKGGGMTISSTKSSSDPSKEAFEVPCFDGNGMSSSTMGHVPRRGRVMKPKSNVSTKQQQQQPIDLTGVVTANHRDHSESDGSMISNRKGHSVNAASSSSGNHRRKKSQIANSGAKEDGSKSGGIKRKASGGASGGEMEKKKSRK